MPCRQTQGPEVQGPGSGYALWLRSNGHPRRARHALRGRGESDPDPAECFPHVRDQAQVIDQGAGRIGLNGLLSSHPTDLEKNTFHRIEWWTDGHRMVKATHTVVSCFCMTFEQPQIV